MLEECSAGTLCLRRWWRLALLIFLKRDWISILVTNFIIVELGNCCLGVVCCCWVAGGDDVVLSDVFLLDFCWNVLFLLVEKNISVSFFFGSFLVFLLSLIFCGPSL